MNTPINPSEGWHVLHQIYEIDPQLWHSQGESGQLHRISQLTKLVQHFRSQPDTQMLLFSVVGRADIGFMLLSPDLCAVDRAEKNFRTIMGPGVLKPSFSFLSLTEESEYKGTDAEFLAQLEKSDNILPDSEQAQIRLKEYNERMAKYRHERVYPKLTDWPTVCFYPMAKRRNVGQNWYALSFDERRRLMAGHARVGRNYAGKVKQIITGATGLSDWEWGVTLFSNDISHFKSIVYEMRFDEVTHTYGEFGPFYIGIIRDPADLIPAVL